MYKVIIDLTLKVNGVVEVFPVGCVINLPEKSAHKLIKQGKIVREPQVVNNEYDNYFQAAVLKVSQIYQDGTIDDARLKYPERWKQCIQIEDIINGQWDKNLQEFKKAADDWCDIYSELVKLFKQDY